MASVLKTVYTSHTGMSKNITRKRRILPWIVAFLTLVLVIISKTAYSAGETDFRQGMTHYKNRQFDQALPCLEKAANAGNTDAQAMMGVLYFRGNGVKQNDSEAARWFEKAARAGETNAQNYLATAYMKGQGTTPDTAKAIYWYTRAAKAGDANAQKILGALYLNGHDGVTKDTAKARQWLRKAADQGDTDAEQLLRQIP